MMGEDMIGEDMIDIVDLGDAFEETRQGAPIPIYQESIFLFAYWPD